MSTGIVKKTLRGKLRRLNSRLEYLLGLPAGLRGTFSRVYTRCGKPSCWCARASQGHPHTRITWSENGKLFTRKVPAERAQDVAKLADNYRHFRAVRRQLRTALAELATLLDLYEQSVIGPTGNALLSLPPRPKLAAYNRQHLPKTGRPKERTK